MRTLTLICLAAAGLWLAGCQSEGGAGDVQKAEKAAAEMPKSADQLPQDMSPEARRAAENAMRAGEAMGSQMQSQMDAQKAAMEKLKASGQVK